MKIKFSFLEKSRGKYMPLIPCPCIATGLINDGDGFICKGVGLHLEWLVWTIAGIRIMWIDIDEDNK